MSIWVLLEEYNDYDQHGEYFVHAWNHKPSREELLPYVLSESRVSRPDYLGFVLSGGGRINQGNYHENQWFILKEIK